MSDKKLKLKVELDSSQVGAEAKKSVQAIDETTAKAEQLAAALDKVAASGQRSFRAVSNLATAAPNLDGAAPAVGALPRAIDSAGGAGRIRLRTGPLGGEQAAVEQVTQRLRGLGSVERFLGVSGIESTINLVRAMPALIADLSAATVAAGVGIVASLAPVYIAFKKYQELVALRKATEEFVAGNNSKTLDGLHDQVTKGITSGELRGDRANTLESNLRDSLTRTKQLQERFAKASTEDGRAHFQKELDYEASKTKGYLAELQSLRQASYATENEAEQSQAETRANRTKGQIEGERQMLEARLAQGKISRRQYADEQERLATEEAATEKGQLQVRERELRETLKRQINDKEAAAKTQIELDKTIGQETEIDAALRRKKQGFENQYNAAAFRPQPVNTDDLARIGLFVGGGGQSNLGAQQLDELKRITQGLQRLETVIQKN